MRTLELTEVPENTRRQLLFRGVRDAREVIGPNVRRAPDVVCPDLDVIRVD
jgi:hypothetical protein